MHKHSKNMGEWGGGRIFFVEEKIIFLRIYIYAWLTL